MGYFANGFAFTSMPNLSAIAKAAPGRMSRGYKHNNRSVWLLDVWKPRGKLQVRRAPFCDPATDGIRAQPATCDEATRGFLDAFRRLKQVLGYTNADPEGSYIHLALAVAGAVGCPTFFFAADDEETDMGGRTLRGSLLSFGCRFDCFSLQYDTNQTVLTPLNFGDEEQIQELVGKARGVTGISILDPKAVEGGRFLYENPIAQWPKEAGDPAEILGFGTWDPLLNLNKDFAVVFENLNP